MQHVYLLPATQNTEPRRLDLFSRASISSPKGLHLPLDTLRSTVLKVELASGLELWKHKARQRELLLVPAVRFVVFLILSISCLTCKYAL